MATAMTSAVLRVERKRAINMAHPPYCSWRDRWRLYAMGHTNPPKRAAAKQRRDCSESSYREHCDPDSEFRRRPAARRLRGCAPLRAGVLQNRRTGDDQRHGHRVPLQQSARDLEARRRRRERRDAALDRGNDVAVDLAAARLEPAKLRARRARHARRPCRRSTAAISCASCARSAPTARRSACRAAPTTDALPYCTHRVARGRHGAGRDGSGANRAKATASRASGRYPSALCRRAAIPLRPKPR